MRCAKTPEGQRAAVKKDPVAAPLTSEEALQQAQAEELTLVRVAESKTGYLCVSHQPDKPKPFQAQVTRGGRKVSMGCFVTAEEAALYVARSPEGKAAAERAAAPAPLTSEEALQQAHAEGLTLLVADNEVGFFGVHHRPGRPKPFQTQLRRGGKKVSAGCFATAEEAALCVARSLEGQAAAKRAPVAAPLTSEKVLQQAQAKGPTLLVAKSKTGCFGVPDRPKPFKAQVKRGGKDVSLGCFATAEEAALCVARSLEGKAAAKRAAVVAPLTSEEALQQAQVEGLTLRVTKSKTGYRGVYCNKPGQPKLYKARVWRGGKEVGVGNFATAEEAALCVARSLVGQVVVWAAVQPHVASGDGCGDDACEEVEVLDAIAVDAWSDDDDVDPNVLLNRGVLEGLRLADSGLSRGRKAKAPGKKRAP